MASSSSVVAILSLSMWQRSSLEATARCGRLGYSPPCEVCKWRGTWMYLCVGIISDARKELRSKAQSWLWSVACTRPAGTKLFVGIIVYWSSWICHQCCSCYRSLERDLCIILDTLWHAPSTWEWRWPQLSRGRSWSPNTTARWRSWSTRWNLPTRNLILRNSCRMSLLGVCDCCVCWTYHAQQAAFSDVEPWALSWDTSRTAWASALCKRCHARSWWTRWPRRTWSQPRWWWSRSWPQP
jgi:hypothetical protein